MIYYLVSDTIRKKVTPKRFALIGEKAKYAALLTKRFAYLYFLRVNFFKTQLKKLKIENFILVGFLKIKGISNMQIK